MNYFKFGSTGLLGSFQLNMLPTSIKVNDVTQYTKHTTSHLICLVAYSLLIVLIMNWLDNHGDTD